MGQDIIRHDKTSKSGHLRPSPFSQLHMEVVLRRCTRSSRREHDESEHGCANTDPHLIRERSDAAHLATSKRCTPVRGSQCQTTSSSNLAAHISGLRSHQGSNAVALDVLAQLQTKRASCTAWHSSGAARGLQRSAASRQRGSGQHGCARAR